MLISMKVSQFKGCFEVEQILLLFTPFYGLWDWSRILSQLPSPRNMRTSINLQTIALIVSTATSALGAHSNSSTCYFLNGELAPQHAPCFPNKVSAGDDSACCDMSNGDVCLDTGICLSKGGSTFQGACTDQNWQSNSCTHRCPDRK